MNDTAARRHTGLQDDAPIGECRILTEFSALDACAPDWERLWRANPNREVFGCFAFAKAWWESYRNTVQLFTPVVGEPGKTAGILPLVIENGRLRFLGYSAFDYNDVLCDPRQAAEVLEALLSAVVQSRPAWRSGFLENVPADSLLARHLPALPAAVRRRCEIVFAADCPTLVLGDGDREETLRRILAKKSLRRHENKLARLGRLRFRHVEDKREILDLLPRLFEQHVRRRALAGDRSRFLREEERAFFRVLVEKLGGKGPLRFAVLEIEDRPAAFHLGFESDGKFLWYLPTFDVNLWDYSPGEVLIRSLVRYVSEHPIRELDFTIGGEGFKSRFANQVKKNLTILLRPPGSRGQIYLAGIRTRESLKQNTPRLFRWMKQAHRLATGRRRHEWWKLPAKTMARLFRRYLCSRVEVLFYQAQEETGAAAEPGEPIHENLTLGEIAELALRYPELLDAARLREAPRRLKQGDRPWVARCDGELVQLSWTGTRDHLRDPEAKTAIRIPVGSPVMMIYESWTPPSFRGHGACSSALRHLAAEARKEGLDTWICCQGRDTRHLHEIEQAGFKRRVQILCWRLFGREKTRVRYSGSSPG